MAKEVPARTPLWHRLFIPVAIVFVLFGLAGIFSIDLPFLIIGTVMIAVWPFRNQHPLFESVLIATLVFVVAAILLAPLGCRASATQAGEVGETACDNLIGIPYRGDGIYNPPLWPAVLGGLAAGTIAWWITSALARRRVPPNQRTHR